MLPARPPPWKVEPPFAPTQVVVKAAEPVTEVVQPQEVKNVSAV